MELEKSKSGSALALLSKNSGSTPQPEYILRGHTSQINTLSFSRTRNLLYSGDSDGYVAVWSLESFRPIVFAKVHSGSVLTVQEWDGDKFISHGRDNKIHTFELRSAEPMYDKLPSPASPSVIQPLYTVDINALGYCKCSLLEVPNHQALVAVPSVLHDELIDIFHLPSCKRVFRSIGKDCFESKTGTVMALALLFDGSEHLAVMATYEDGRAAFFRLIETLEDWSEGLAEENEGWGKVFDAKQHREPTMSLALEANLKQAWSVAADHLVVRYSLEVESKSDSRARGFKTAYPGRASIAVRDDDRILAIAGWDGSVRVHSAKSFKPLAVLDYHRDSVYTVAFASVAKLDSEVDASSTPQGRKQQRRRRAWLGAAGKDERISLWELYPPSGQ